jgi:hypothetical protein
MKDTKQMDFKIMMGIVYSSLLIEHYDELEEAYKLKLPKKLKGAIYTGKQELEKFGTAIFKNASKQDIEAFEIYQKMLLQLLKAFQEGKVEVQND